MSRRAAVRNALIGVLLLPVTLYFIRSYSYPPEIADRPSPREIVRKLIGSDDDDFSGEQGWFGSNWSGGENSNQGGKSDEDGSDVWVDLNTDLRTTTYDGGIPGYSIFSNLYLSSSTFLAVRPSIPLPGQKDIPPVRHIMSASKSPKGGYPAAGEDVWRVIDGEEMARDELGKTAILLKGVTYIFNDGPGGDGYLVYFRHFVLEAFLGATRVLSSKFPEKVLPKRIWFPRCGASPSWRDDRGENVWFLNHALPSASIEDASGFADRNTAGLPIILETAVIVDRWAAHSVGGEVGKWGKMNADIPSALATIDFFEPYRISALKSLGVYQPTVENLPVVIYVDRQRETPKVLDGDHARFLEALKGLTGKAEIHVTRLSAMTKAQQVALVLIGLHGDEIMNAIWMKAAPGSTVIELYEEDGFERDYQLMASTLFHTHIAIHNDHILDEEGWRQLGSKRGPNAKGEIPVDGVFVAGVVERILDDLV
ncbi:short coiled-coil protein, partial [Tremellales sp. Uapishka_1]